MPAQAGIGFLVGILYNQRIQALPTGPIFANNGSVKASSNTTGESGSDTDMLPSGMVAKNTEFCPGCNYARRMEAELRQLKVHYDALRQKALRLSTQRNPEVDNPLAEQVPPDFEN